MSVRLIVGLMTGVVVLGSVPAVAVPLAGADRPTRVYASVETAPTLHTGDSADDPAIWVAPSKPGRSLVIGNDKQGALEVYNLDGSLRQRVTTGTTFWGNVDVRQGVEIAGIEHDVVAAMNGGLRLFDVAPHTRTLVSVLDGPEPISTGGGEGLCLYSSHETGHLYAFVVARSGRVRQFRITDTDADGTLDATVVRQFALGSEGEGCVADDALGRVYFSEEDVALWRIAAEPDASLDRHRVDTVGAGGHLVADAEGVTLALAGKRTRLIVSAQNVAHPRRSYFVAYNRRANAYVGSFDIANGPSTDGCERTDGVAAYVGSLGTLFPDGLFVCQDDTNSSPGVGHQDFKLVPFQRVARALR